MKSTKKNNRFALIGYAKSMVLLVTIILFISSCGKNKKEEKEGEETERDFTSVTISEEQYKSANVELGNIQLKNLTSAIKTNGRLSLPPQNKAIVSTPYGGIVKEINVSTGQLVTKGTKLAIIQNPDVIQLQQDYLENASHLDFIKNDFIRQKTLQKDNITSQKHFQETEADYKGAVAKDNALKAKLQILGINADAIKDGKIIPYLIISAPISGYVQEIKTNIGTFAEPNSMLFEIINNTDLHIDLQLFEKDIRKIANGQKVYFSYINSGAVTLQDTAVVFAIDKEFDAQTQSVIVHAKIQHPKGIMLPGMYVEARIITDNENVLSVPDGAIVSQGDEHYIFIQILKQNQDKKHFFKRIPVVVGTNDLGNTAIVASEKLSDDVKIVIKGAYALLSEMNRSGDEE